MRRYLLSYGKERLEQTGKTYTLNGQKVKARKRTNNKWFETQDSISYWDDFSRPKLLYSEIVREPKFYLDPDGQFLPEATTFMMTGQHLEYLLAVLQSSSGAYFFRHFYAGGGLGDEVFRYKKAFLIQLPIPPWEDTPLQRQIVAAPAGSNVESLVCASLSPHGGGAGPSHWTCHNTGLKPRQSQKSQQLSSPP